MDPSWVWIGMVINPIVGVYIPMRRIPIKGGMPIPNIATFDHGTYEGCFFTRQDSKTHLQRCGITSQLPLGVAWFGQSLR